MFRTFFLGVVHQRSLVLFMATMVAVMGMAAWRTLPIDAFPDVTNVQVMILTEAPGMAPVDVERQVTWPIELEMGGLPDVTIVRSMSKAELSQVVVVFEDQVDVWFARQVVFERLQSARETLPSWAEPRLGPVSTGLGEIFQYTLESDHHSLQELRSIQDWLVAPMLRPLRGITEVNSFGGFVEQVQVLVDPLRLEGRGIDVRDVVAALSRNNATAGGGYILKGEEQAYIRCVGLLRNDEDVANVVVASRDGTPILIRDVAEVRRGPAPRQGAVTRDGKGETVAGMVILLRGANSREAVAGVRRMLPEVRKALPEGVRLSPFYDRTTLIADCVGTISNAILSGGILVVLALVLLIGSLRTALVVIVSLPMAALLTFIGMRALDLSANLMSLGGLAIAIGMVVDSSIMVAENMLRRLAEGDRSSERNLMRAASRACTEVARPLLFAELIIIVTFLPLLTLEGMEGKLFRPLAMTLCLAIVASVVTAFTVVPAMAAVILRRVRSSDEGRLMSLVHHAYLWVLHRSLGRPRLTVALAVLAFGLAMATVPHLGTEFMPPLDEGSVAINIVRLPSAALDESVRQTLRIEERLRAIPEVETVVSKTGRAAVSEDPMGPEQSDVYAMLRPRSTWAPGRTKTRIVEDMRAILADLPGLKPAFSQPIALRVNELISGIKSDLAVKIFGPDLERLRELGGQVATALGTVPGARDVKVEQITGFPQVDITLDRAALARHGLDGAAVAEVVEACLGGTRATTIVDGRAHVDVSVRVREEWRSQVARIGRLLIRTPGGYAVPLERLARITEEEAPALVSRENGNRRVVVEANVGRSDLGGFVAEVQERLEPLRANLPPGYWLEYGGTFENQIRAERRLAVVVPLSIMLVFVMLLAAFGSVRTATLVLTNLPFACIGGVAAAWLTGTVLSVPAVIGFIALFGTSTQDGVVLVSFIDDLRRTGRPLEAAIVEGCSLRLRSVVLTSVTTILGLVPLLAATGPGAEIQRPLATVVLGGMASALVLVLVVLPAVYSLRPPDVDGPREGPQAA